jgi:hypothetical protein
VIGKVHPHGQLRHRVQERVLDPGQQRRQAPAIRQRRRVVPDGDVHHRRRPRQLGPGLRVQRAGGGQKLLHPGLDLAPLV